MWRLHFCTRCNKSPNTHTHTHSSGNTHIYIRLEGEARRRLWLLFQGEATNSPSLGKHCIVGWRWQLLVQARKCLGVPLSDAAYPKPQRRLKAAQKAVLPHHMHKGDHRGSGYVCHECRCECPVVMNALILLPIFCLTFNVFGHF